MAKRTKKRAKQRVRRRDSADLKRQIALADRLIDIEQALNSAKLRLNRIETVLAPELTKLLDLQPPVRAEVFHRKQSEPDTPETVAEKAKQARDVMTKAADALGG